MKQLGREDDRPINGVTFWQTAAERTVGAYLEEAGQWGQALEGKLCPCALPVSPASQPPWGRMPLLTISLEKTETAAMD